MMLIRDALFQIHMSIVSDRSIHVTLSSEQLDFRSRYQILQLMRNQIEQVVQAEAIVSTDQILVIYLLPNQLLDSEQKIRNIVWELDWLEARVAESQLIEVPVCYGGEFGPDLEDIATAAGKEVSAWVAWHQSLEFDAVMIGFRPGFAYLQPMNVAMFNHPRRKTPRTKLPKGAVGLGGPYCGIYPDESPGGWNWVGTTPQHPLIRLGDRVKFYSIDQEVFNEIELKGRMQNEPNSLERMLNCEAVKIIHPGTSTMLVGLENPMSIESGGCWGGVMDRVSMMLANVLVGNKKDIAVLEVFGRGLSLRVDADGLLGWYGSRCSIQLNGQSISWCNQAMQVQQGDELRFGTIDGGLRGWLSIRGGWSGDRKEQCAVDMHFLESKYRQSIVMYNSRKDRIVRVIAESQEPFDTFFAHRTYRMSPNSNRIGIRLEIQESLDLTQLKLIELKNSVPVHPGVIQLPPEGNPIILMADAQSTGGYPIIGRVIRADLGILAGLRPGEMIRFDVVSIDQAVFAWNEQSRFIDTTEKMISCRGIPQVKVDRGGVS